MSSGILNTIVERYSRWYNVSREEMKALVDAAVFSYRGSFMCVAEKFDKMSRPSVEPELSMQQAFHDCNVDSGVWTFMIKGVLCGYNDCCKPKCKPKHKKKSKREEKCDNDKSDCDDKSTSWSDSTFAILVALVILVILLIIVSFWTLMTARRVPAVRTIYVPDGYDVSLKDI